MTKALDAALDELAAVAGAESRDESDAGWYVGARRVVALFTGKTEGEVDGMVLGRLGGEL